MQKQHLLKEQNGASLKEQNGASLKPETHTPSFALDFPVVVIDEMTTGGEHRGKGEAEHAPSPQQPEHVNVTNWINLKVVWSAATKLYGRR